MSLWLGLDTATDRMGVALAGADGIVVESTWAMRRGHTARLASRVADALAHAGIPAADLAGLAVAIGPGSYTGLRVGLAFAKGIATASGARIVGVPTLDILAAGLSLPDCRRESSLWCVLKAGRGRVVAARYAPGEGTAAPTDPAPLPVALASAAPGDWVAGELEPADVSWCTEAGLLVTCPAHSVRRPGILAAWVLDGRPGRLEPGVALLSPLYPGRAEAQLGH